MTDRTPFFAGLTLGLAGGRNRRPNQKAAHLRPVYPPRQENHDMVADQINQQRQRIDEIDRQIVDLLNERALCAMAIGRSKNAGGLPEFAPEREQAIIDALERHNQGPLSGQSLRGIFAEIISACRAVQRPLRVAFLGPATTFSHQAAMRHFGSSCEFAPHRSIIDVFHEVERSHAQVGVVPVENSSEGQVSVTLDLFLESDLNVCGEIYARISQVLMSKEAAIEGIQRVYSHPQALNQCRNWLARNMPMATLIESTSTAAAAQKAAQEDGSAAVGSILAARQGGLNALAIDIQDNPHNTTRFFVIGRQKCPPTGNDKTSILFVTHHKPGMLFSALKHFADSGINLTRIESRPLKNTPWEYVFFIDMAGHVEDAQVRQVINTLDEETRLLKVLGSYPMGEPEAWNGAEQAV
ncbi:prephenate dehydratase [Desulfarculus baarsii DSM 2075]|uniref:Bifunctional chorismate mutase/prephenate dehydratase n=1 Tax=Desulfarculus baarsii (strain ATCC 33931 / DSM 2075 / LMG 7858 / VKM B-1802 / 2st14) TaxID=644282 RepID=E1QE66_DESB2|nr:prephenate dehydratase [Desulfarculus baarsii]ADK83852.1 prephenate dehydratase [Desulfarculus baarsii DSM 2075]